jgi:hypothetical protein
VNEAIGWLNRLVTGSFDLVLLPFRSLAPMWGLTAISLAAGILMLWLFGKVSDQETIRVVRDRIRGNLIGIRLFGDDLGLLFRLQLRIFRQTLTYMKHALVPMLVLLVPVLLILIQLNLRFESRPLRPGERTVVRLTLRAGAADVGDVSLSVPDGVSIETPGVRSPATDEVAWRVRADRPGAHRLRLRAGADEVQTTLLVDGGWGPVPTLKSARPLDLLLYPGEAPIDPDSRIRSVEVRYAALPLSLLGFDVDWLLFFFVASIAFGFAFKGVLGVEI